MLIAGINLYLLASIVETLLGWKLWVSLLVAAAIVLTYTTLGGLSAAIYNEVLQFFIIVAALLPLTLIALHKIGGWDGLTDKVTQQPRRRAQLSSWPGPTSPASPARSGPSSGSSSGSGFVLSFGYWTTNFVEVQRAMASSSMSAAQRAPIIGSFPKMFIPFIVIIPGMIAAVAVPELATFKAGEAVSGEVDYNNAILYLMRDLLPNGMLGLAIAGLLASFMAGMAANISAFNTVFSYDLCRPTSSRTRRITGTYSSSSTPPTRSIADFCLAKFAMVTQLPSTSASTLKPAVSGWHAQTRRPVMELTWTNAPAAPLSQPLSTTNAAVMLLPLLRAEPTQVLAT